MPPFMSNHLVYKKQKKIKQQYIYPFYSNNIIIEYFAEEEFTEET